MAQVFSQKVPPLISSNTPCVSPLLLFPDFLLELRVFECKPYWIVMTLRKGSSLVCTSPSRLRAPLTAVGGWTHQRRWGADVHHSAWDWDTLGFLLSAGNPHSPCFFLISSWFFSSFHCSPSLFLSSFIILDLRTSLSICSHRAPSSSFLKAFLQTP